jgi:hypothetical protein
MVIGLGLEYIISPAPCTRRWNHSGSMACVAKKELLTVNPHIRRLHPRDAVIQPKSRAASYLDDLGSLDLTMISVIGRTMLNEGSSIRQTDATRQGVLRVIAPPPRRPTGQPRTPSPPTPDPVDLARKVS